MSEAYIYKSEEAVSPEGVIQKLLWKISENSNQNTCAGVPFFIKVQAVDVELC